jgi:uncharacterized membrane protein YphA (DoxX/SURF4 family)
MRVALGVVLAAQAIEKMLQLRELQGELILSGVPHPELVAISLLALELSAALMLVMGRHLRLAGIATLCDALIAAALVMLQHRTLELHARLETSALMAATAFFLATMRSTSFVRRRAPDERELSQQPDAALPSETLIYETPDGRVYETEAPRRSQRRWTPRSAG